MPDELVIDASVAAKIFFTEDGSEAARALAVSGQRFCAPEFIALEIASIGAKYARKGEIDVDHGRQAIQSLGELIDHFEPVLNLSERAVILAVEHGFSVYDASYLALAEARESRVVTADRKLHLRAQDAGLGALTQLL